MRYKGRYVSDLSYKLSRSKARGVWCSMPHGEGVIGCMYNYMTHMIKVVCRLAVMVRDVEHECGMKWLVYEIAVFGKRNK